VRGKWSSLGVPLAAKLGEGGSGASLGKVEATF